MANYFQGTIRLLQSMIMDERQRAAEKESPQYQFAVEKLAAQKRQNLLQQTILGKLASGGSPEEVARLAGDYQTLLKVPLQKAQTGAYKALTGQRQQSAELSKEKMETEEKRQIRQGTLADLDKARIRELDRIKPNTVPPEESLFNRGREDFLGSISKLSPKEIDVKNEYGQTIKQEHRFPTKQQERSYKHESHLQTMYQFGLRDTDVKKYGYTEASLVKDYGNMQNIFRFTEEEAVKVLKSGYNFKRLKTIITDIKRKHPGKVKGLNNGDILRMAMDEI